MASNEQKSGVPVLDHYKEFQDTHRELSNATQPGNNTDAVKDVAINKEKGQVKGG